MSAFDTLQKFSENLRRLPRVVAAKVAEKSAGTMTELGRSTFAQSRDAYGNAWPVGSDGETVDLVESGALSSHLRYKAIGSRLRSELGVSYAKYQIGRRPVYPRGALPAAYVEALARTAVAVCREELGV